MITPTGNGIVIEGDARLKRTLLCIDGTPVDLPNLLVDRFCDVPEIFGVRLLGKFRIVIERMEEP